jgi:hypothetical protein
MVKLKKMLSYLFVVALVSPTPSKQLIKSVSPKAATANSCSQPGDGSTGG